ncbi:MAG: cytochrome c biogenesis protein CcdA, partial [Acidimicrobiia bacterium]
MFDVPFAFAFGAGMIATVNPCGFAMLPAYLGFFVGTDTGSVGSSARIRRILAVSGMMTLGFVVVFGAVGLLVQTVASGIDEQLSKVTVVVGVVLTGLGVWLVTGHAIRGLGVRLDRGGRDRTLTSMFVYGLSYAIASLSCTLGPFLVALTPTFRNHGTAAGVTAFLAYGLGMGAVVTAVTLVVGLAKAGVLERIRRAGPWVNRVSGVLLVFAGLYVTWYGIWELQGNFDADPIIDGASNIQVWLTERVDGLPRVPIAIGLLILVAWALVVGIRRRGSTPPPPIQP